MSSSSLSPPASATSLSPPPYTPPPGSLAEKPKGARSWVWDHVFPFDATNFHCKYCNIDPQTKKGKIKKSKTGATSNIKSHLIAFHSDIPAVRNGLLGESPDGQATFNDELVRFFAAHQMPFRVAESESFRSLIRAANTTITVMDRKLLASSLSGRAKQIREKTAEVLHGQKVSFTSDGYKKRGFSLMSFVASFVNDNWEPCQMVLSCKEVRGRQTIQRLVDESKSVFSEYGIYPVAGVTDAAANAKGTIRQLGIDSILCAAHLINLAVKESLGSMDEEYSLIERCRRAAEKLHRSAPVAEKFADILKSQNMPVVGIPQECPTRWNSTFFLLEGCIRTIDAVNITAKELGITAFTPLEIATLQSLVAVLRTPLDATLKLSRDHSTASETLPLLYQVTRLLRRKSLSESGAARDLAEHLVQSFSRRIKGHKDHSRALAYAMYLDPRWSGRKGMLAENDDGTEWNSVREELVAIYGGDEPDGSSSTATAAPATSSGDLFDMLDEPQVTEEKPTTGPSALTAEMCKYEATLTASRPPSSASALDWWKCNCGTFPLMSALARRLLGIPSTSVSSERLFSVATSVSANRRRNRLSARALEDTLIVSCNKTPSGRLRPEKPRPVRLLPRRSIEEDDGHTSAESEDSEAEDLHDNVIDEEEETPSPPDSSRPSVSRESIADSLDSGDSPAISSILKRARSLIREPSSPV